VHARCSHAATVWFFRQGRTRQRHAHTIRPVALTCGAVMLSSRYNKRLPEVMSRCLCFALGCVPGPCLTTERNQTIQSTTCITLIMISSNHCQQQLYCTVHLPHVLLLSSRACMICVAYLHPHQYHSRIPGCYTPAGLTEHAVYTEITCALRVAASDGSYTSVWGTGCTAVHTLMTIIWCCITLVHQS
jgi:hypothetical protein